MIGRTPVALAQMFAQMHSLAISSCLGEQPMCARQLGLEFYTCMWLDEG